MAISNTTDRFNGVVASLAIKVRCVVGVEVNVASLSGISNPYSGVNIVDLDRVLLTAQTDPIENGVWDAKADGVWTRAFDWDGNRDVEKGSTVWAGQQTGEDKLWQVQTEGTILPGSTAQSITELLNPELLNANPILLAEIAAADASVAGFGQIWVRDDAPNVLVFTDDDGDDHDLLSLTNPIVLAEIAAAGAFVDGFGQIWVRDDAPNVLVFTDDTGIDTVLGSGGGGGFQGLGVWRYRTEVTSTPATGRMQLDNLTIDSATEMYVNEVNDGGTDMTAFLDLIVSGDLIYVQIQADSSQFIIVETGTPTKATGVYTFPIQIVEGQGATPSNNTTVAIIATHGGGASGGAVTQIEDGSANVAVIAEGGGTIGIRSVGNTDSENRDLEWQHQDGTTRFSIGQESSTAIIVRNHITGADIIFRVGIGGGNRTRLQLTGDQTTGGIIMSAGTNPSGGHLRVFDDGVRIQNTMLFIRQEADGEADISTFGQLWVRNDNPQTLLFRDDDGTDTVVAGSPTGTYTRNATVVEDRTLLASASATTLNNNNVLAALIADLTTRGVIG